MSTLRSKQDEKSEISPSPKQVLEAKAELPIIASARTGLAGKDNSLVRRIPVEYAGKTVKEVLEYIIQNDITSEEASLAKSLEKELGSKESVVVINGKKADLSDRVEKYLAVRNHTLPDEQVKQYRELEIEVSAVQQGGFYRFL